MRKLALFICILATSAWTFAQDDCMAFFPDVKGTVMISKSYDINNRLENIITYTIEEAYQNMSGPSVLIRSEITDAQGNLINRGKIDANCTNGSFFLKTRSEASTDAYFDLLGRNTQLVGNFLDYPNNFSDPLLLQTTFSMTPGEYKVESNGQEMSVRVYDRKYEGTETITTPAGTYNASKISFMFETRRNDVKETRKGIEWISTGAGIVRSETFDDKGNMISYTVLTSLQQP